MNQSTDPTTTNAGSAPNTSAGPNPTLEGRVATPSGEGSAGVEGAPEKCPVCRFEKLPRRAGFNDPPEKAIVNLCACDLGMTAPPQPLKPQALDQFTAWTEPQRAVNVTYEALHGGWVAERLSDPLLRSRRLGEAYRLAATRLPEAVVKLRRTLEAPRLPVNLEPTQMEVGK